MSDILPHTNRVPVSDVQQLQDETWKLGDPIPEPDPETPSIEEELPPATDDILSTQPINWAEAVEVQVVPPTTVDTVLAVLTAMRDALDAYGVWDARDQLEYDRLNSLTSEQISDLVFRWGTRISVQLHMEEPDDER
jgi:hypothetical protein